MDSTDLSDLLDLSDLSDLPDVLLYKIFSYLEPSEIVHGCSIVSRWWNKLSLYPLLWPEGCAMNRYQLKLIGEDGDGYDVLYKPTGLRLSLFIQKKESISVNIFMWMYANKHHMIVGEYEIFTFKRSKSIIPVIIELDHSHIMPIHLDVIVRSTIMQINTSFQLFCFRQFDHFVKYCVDYISHYLKVTCNLYDMDPNLLLLCFIWALASICGAPYDKLDQLYLHIKSAFKEQTDAIQIEVISFILNSS